ALIEWSQKNKLKIVFEVVKSFIDNNGNAVFQSEVTLLDHRIGVGIGYSKKESQQNAAKVAAKKLRADKGIRSVIADFRRKPRNNRMASSVAGKLSGEPYPDNTTNNTVNETPE
ncbi:MAG: ribonuclease III, partial [Tannerellaceae bacterium]|nr:ribonuclease III [Tannerellaceae bacterium]